MQFMILEKLLPNCLVCKIKEWKIGLLVHEFFFQIPYIVYFNFRYLPWKQAIRLPIWVHVRSYRGPKGRFVIENDTIKPGMIILGPRQFYYYNNGLDIVSNGTIVFRGNCWISNETRICLGRNAQLTIGDNAGISSSKISCDKSIELGKHVFVGMDCSIMDSDFHAIIDLVGRVYVSPSIPVKIGDYNWLGAETMVMKGTRTPRHVIVGARSVLNKRYRIPECSCLMAVGGKEIVSEGFVLDWKNLAEGMSSRKIINIDEIIKELDISV